MITSSTDCRLTTKPCIGLLLFIADNMLGVGVCNMHRVKELGPGSAADAGKAPEVAPGGAPLSPQKSDLALLRNANVSESV